MFVRKKKNRSGSVDMTTIYFASDQPVDFKQTGFSKEGKHQHPQIYLDPSHLFAQLDALY
jgi:hypothetical protein